MSLSRALNPLQVGPIPNHWTSAAIADVTELLTNGFVGQCLSHQTTDDTGVLYLQGFNIRPNRIDIGKKTSVSRDFHNRNKKSCLREGDVLVVQSGHIGTAAVVPRSLGEANCHALIIVRFDGSKINPEFFAQYINSDIGQVRLRGLHVGSSLPHINTGELGHFCIPVPPISEQDKFVSICNTWDTAIEKTEKLIEAKEKHKKVLSTALLFGKLRLGKRQTAGRRQKKWFSVPDDWQMLNIAAIASETGIKNQEGGCVPVLSCTKYQGLVDSLKYFDKQIFSEDTSSYKVVGCGEFAYATNHIEEGSIGYQNLYPKGLVSPMYTVFKTDRKQVNDGYLYKLLKTETYRHIFEVNTSASVARRGSLRWNEFSKLPVPLPSLDEQNEINRVLETAEKEIKLLARELELLKKQKNGLLQKLLSGQWSVNIRKEDK